MAHFYTRNVLRHVMGQTLPPPPPTPAPGVIGNKSICEDIIIVLNLLKLKALKIIVILLDISKKVVTLSFALNDDYGKHFTDI